MLAAAGTPRRTAPLPLFPLLHPAAVRSRATAERWERDVTALGRWLLEPAFREPL
jgi:hypothetical protein